MRNKSDSVSYKAYCWGIILGLFGLVMSSQKNLAFGGNEPLDLKPVKLVEQGYQGFNIIERNRKYYALAQSEGAFKMDKVTRNGYKKLFIADSIQEAKDWIDQSLATPKLAQEGYQGFNIISLGTHFYGLGQNEGPFSLAKVNRNKYKRIFSGKSVDDVKREIDRDRVLP